MHSIIWKILANSLIVLLALPMTFHAAVAEQVFPSETPRPTVQAEEAPTNQFVAPKPSDEAHPEVSVEVWQPSPEPEVQAAPDPASAAEPGLVEIQSEPIPLSAAPEPGITVFANRDLSNLHIGDTLMLTCELVGFSGLNTSIHWQALVNDQWKDLPNENAAKLIIKITADNADWSYRAAVDAQPVV